MAQRQRHMMIILVNQFWCPTVDSLTTFVFQRCVCFFVLCNRHWFNKAPGPDPRGPSWGLPIYPSLLAQTLAVPIYPYPYWEPQSALGVWRNLGLLQSKTETGQAALPGQDYMYPFGVIGLAPLYIPAGAVVVNSLSDRT